jgi:hypothetical protein
VKGVGHDFITPNIHFIGKGVEMSNLFIFWSKYVLKMCNFSTNDGLDFHLLELETYS